VNSETLRDVYDECRKYLGVDEGEYVPKDELVAQLEAEGYDGGDARDAINLSVERGELVGTDETVLAHRDGEPVEADGSLRPARNDAEGAKNPEKEDGSSESEASSPQERTTQTDKDGKRWVRPTESLVGADVDDRGTDGGSDDDTSSSASSVEDAPDATKNTEGVYDTNAGVSRGPDEETDATDPETRANDTARSRRWANVDIRSDEEKDEGANLVDYVNRRAEFLRRAYGLDEKLARALGWRELGFSTSGVADMMSVAEGTASAYLEELRETVGEENVDRVARPVGDRDVTKPIPGAATREGSS
jgi:hypothetical protein